MMQWQTFIIIIIIVWGLKDKERVHCSESSQIEPVRLSGKVKLETGKTLATKKMMCWEVDSWSGKQREEGKHLG